MLYTAREESPQLHVNPSIGKVLLIKEIYIPFIFKMIDIYSNLVYALRVWAHRSVAVLPGSTWNGLSRKSFRSHYKDVLLHKSHDVSTYMFVNNLMT